MLEIGRICIKIAGRDAGKTCVIVDEVDANHVLIDGETRRRKCNKKHLEPTEQVLKIRKAASHDTIKVEFKKLGMDLDKRKKERTKPKQERPKKQKKKKIKPEPKEVKKKPKKEEKKVEKKKIEKQEEKSEAKKEPKKEEIKKQEVKTPKQETK